ncbi:formyltransferase family protein [Paludicola sp. MB14-C6]|uniref:formyltransferase family protein n=1 Tax=Paludihabitans sp. MB14-C6 TaxID=3070656 RepID=UPI0027DC8603|nr:formyltransferase family protein [Paludicola sp. MB14-C6]WMJ24447.1 formyltransferase family protein [Paludicola sp. MB14-C6]
MVESGVILFLTNNDISFEVYKWLKKSEKVILYNDKLTLDVVLTIQPSYIISYNYKYIITNDIIQFMQNKIINMHISLLPYNKGASPNFFSFYDNTPKGVTIHLIDKGIDTGDILCQKEVYFDEEDETWESSYLKLHQQIQQLFYENWESIKNGNIMPSKQYGNGTFHTKAELKELKQRFPFSWNETIAEYKKKYNIGGL